MPRTPKQKNSNKNSQFSYVNPIFSNPSNNINNVNNITPINNNVNSNNNIVPMNVSPTTPMKKLKDNNSLPKQTQKKQFKEMMLEKIYSSDNLWKRDSSLLIPKNLPTENFPFLQPRLNTHHGASIILIDDKEQPLENADCLWIGAKINKTQFKDKQLTECYEKLLMIMAEKIVQKLLLLKPSIINANVFLVNPNDSQVIHIIFVVSHSSS